MNRNSSKNKNFNSNNTNKPLSSHTKINDANFGRFRNNNNKINVEQTIGVVSTDVYKNFKNQDYHNLNDFNFYGSNNKQNNISINNANNENNQIFNANRNNNLRSNIVENLNTINQRNEIRSQNMPRNNNNNQGNVNNNGNINFEMVLDRQKPNTVSNRNNQNINNNPNLAHNLNENNVKRKPDFIVNPYSANNNKNIPRQNNNQNNSNKPLGTVSKTILQKIKSAKTSGTINISNMDLISLPREIFDDTVRFEDINWWELTDIKKIDATNNKIDETFNNENISFEAVPNLNYLKFTNNNFSEIPFSIFSLYELKYLDFSDNKINNLNENIRQMKNLVDLNLHNNSLMTVTNEIGKLSELEILNLSANKISKIPMGFSGLKKLKKLDLSNNFLDSIPKIISSLYQLEELILFKNKINFIEKDSLSNLSNLKYLDLHNNCLEFLDEIPKSQKFDSLILGYNRIEGINNLQNAPNLSVVDLNNNKIENFPKEIINLRNLITLNVMNNSINDIPPQLCFLAKLVRLNIEGNPLRRLNSKLRSANAEQIKSYLKTRIVDENEIEYNDNLRNDNKNNKNNNINQGQNFNKANDNNQMDIEENNNNYNSYNNYSNSNSNSKESRIILGNFLQNNYLKLNKQEIENIPIENFIMNNINNCIGLDISHNKLKDLNFFDQLPDFIDLMEMKINNNKLNYISPKIVDFKNLKCLEFKNNNLTEFLEDINFDFLVNENKSEIPIPKLQVNQYNNLNQRNKTNNSNNIKEKLFSLQNSNEENEIENSDSHKNSILPNLEYLDISSNKLKNIPRIIKYLGNLNTLLLTNNQINNADLLMEIKTSLLFTLELGTNKIQILPEKLYLQFPNIKHLGLENNEIKSVPTDFCLFKNINKVTLNGNPLKQLRSNIITGGTKTILEYLRKMHKFTEEELILDGNKSSFLNFDNHLQQEEKFGGRKRTQFDAQIANQNLTSPQNENKKTPLFLNEENNEVNNFNLEGNGNSTPRINNNVNNNNFNQKNNNNFNQNNASNKIININESAQINNNFIEDNNYNNFNESQNVPMSIDSELDIINQQILGVEGEMQGDMPMFKKTDLRKKLNELIRKRAAIMKKY